MAEKVTMASLAKEIGEVRGALNVHLAECAILREDTIRALGQLSKNLDWLFRGAICLVLAIMGWLAVQLWADRGHRIDGIERAARPVAEAPR